MNKRMIIFFISKINMYIYMVHKYTYTGMHKKKNHIIQAHTHRHTHMHADTHTHTRKYTQA